MASRLDVRVSKIFHVSHWMKRLIGKGKGIFSWCVGNAVYTSVLIPEKALCEKEPEREDRRDGHRRHAIDDRNYDVFETQLPCRGPACMITAVSFHNLNLYGSPRTWKLECPFTEHLLRVNHI